jgi:hypothetical protein
LRLGSIRLEMTGITIILRSKQVIKLQVSFKVRTRRVVPYLKSIIILLQINNDLLKQKLNKQGVPTNTDENQYAASIAESLEPFWMLLAKNTTSGGLFGIL